MVLTINKNLNFHANQSVFLFFDILIQPAAPSSTLFMEYLKVWLINSSGHNIFMAFESYFFLSHHGNALIIQGTLSAKAVSLSN